MPIFLLIFICLHFNYCIDIGEFLHKFKNADIILVNKKKGKNLLHTCQHTTKFDYFDKILLPSQCRFHKDYSFQHCLLAMLENFKKSVDDGNEFGALLIYLYKAFDYIVHKLLIAKLFWYGVSPTALKLIHSCLRNKT